MKNIPPTSPAPNATAAKTDEPWIPFDERPIEYVDPRTLTIHGYVENDPSLDLKDPRLRAKERVWDERKSCRPLLVTPDNEVVSGRHSLRHSLRRNWPKVPLRRIAKDEIVEAADKDFIHHHRMSASVRAYLAAPKIGPNLQAARERRTAILKGGGKLQLPELPGLTEYAEELDINRTYLSQADQLHQLFAKTKAEHNVDGAKLRKQWEPLILNHEEPMSLADALRGATGQAETAGKPAKAAKNSFLNNFKVAGGNLARAAAGWLRWTEGERDLVCDAIGESLAKLPAEALDGFADAVKAARKKQAKAAEEKAEAKVAAPAPAKKPAKAAKARK